VGAPRTNTLTLFNTGKFAANSSGISNLVLSVAPSSGVITGRFLDPQTHLTTAIKGAVLQQQGYAGGFFVSTNATGIFQINP
jgi:hypothetical protein